FSAATAPLEGIRTRIQEGLRSTGASTNSTGERAILSPATCLAPGTSGAGASPTTDSGMDFGWAVSDMRGCRWRDGRSRCVLRRQPQLRGQGRDQGALGGLETCGTPAVYHRGHGEAGVAAGVDAVEGRQVHGDVEGQAVEAAAVAHPDAERGDLGAIHVDARGALAALAADAPAGQGVDDRLLDPAHVLAHAEAQAAQVQERVGHQLAGAVVGDLAAAIHLEHRDVAGRQQVLQPTGLAEGEDGVVLDQPQLVGRGLVAGVGERLHGPPHRLVGDATEVAHAQGAGRVRRYSVHFTSGCSRSAACALSYSSREWARKVRRTDTKRPPLDSRRVRVSWSTVSPAARSRFGTSFSRPAEAGPMAVISKSPGNWKP